MKNCVIIISHGVISITISMPMSWLSKIWEEGRKRKNIFQFILMEGLSNLQLAIPETIEKLFFSLALGLSDPAFNVRHYLLLCWSLVKFSTKLTVSLEYQYQKLHWISALFSPGWSRSKISPSPLYFRTYLPDKNFSTKKMRQTVHRPPIPGWWNWRILHNI